MIFTLSPNSVEKLYFHLRDRIIRRGQFDALFITFHSIVYLAKHLTICQIGFASSAPGCDVIGFHLFDAIDIIFTIVV